QQVSEGRMIVITAAAAFAVDPIARDFIEVLADVRFPVRVLAVNVSQERVKIIRRGNTRWRIIAQHIRERAERLARGERPDRAVPFASANTMRTELGMPPFRGGDSIRRAEALRISQLIPRSFVSFAAQRQFE